MWVEECVVKPAGRAVRHTARRIATKKAAVGLGVTGTGIALPPPKPYIRQGGPVCTWVWREGAGGALYGGALPPGFEGLPSYAYGYGGAPMTSGLLGARDYADSISSPALLGGGASILGGIGSYRPAGNFAQAGQNQGGSSAGGDSSTGGDKPGGETIIGIPPVDVVRPPATPVPEPASMALFAVGLVALIYVRRRRLRRA